MTLFEIRGEILSCIDEETGEIIDEQKLVDLQMALDKKIEGVALWVKNLKADAEAIKKEKLAMQKRQQTCENKIKSLENFLAYALNGQEFSSPKVEIKYRKSESVEITDPSLVPEEYLVYKDPEFNKKLLSTDLKKGNDIPGAKLTPKYNLQIK